MNKVLSRLIVVVSAMSFLSLFSDGRIPSLIISVCIGLFAGIGVSFLFSRSKKPNIWITLLLILLSLPICYFSCKLFIKVWLPSDNAFRTVITKIFPDYSHGLKIVGYVLGVLSIPAVACLLWNAGYYFFCFFKLIEYKKFWNNLTEDMSFAKILKRIGTVFLHGIIAVAVGTLLLAGVYCLPVGGIAVFKSSRQLDRFHYDA